MDNAERERRSKQGYSRTAKALGTIYGALLLKEWGWTIAAIAKALLVSERRIREILKVYYIHRDLFGETVKQRNGNGEWHLPTEKRSVSDREVVEQVKNVKALLLN